MKVKDLRAKSAGELSNELGSLLKAQFNLRMQRGVGQLSRNHQFKETRKDIARIKTLLNEKKIGGGKS